MRLAVFCENLLDRHAGLLFYVQVHIDKLHIERGGQAAADRCFAAAHEAAENYIARFYDFTFYFFVHFPFPVSFGSLCAEKPCRFRFRIADELFDIAVFKRRAVPELVRGDRLTDEHAHAADSFEFAACGKL